MWLGECYSMLSFFTPLYLTIETRIGLLLMFILRVESK
nr:MAG TPA: hypothetical protein [Caudoviricetes sp.]